MLKNILISMRIHHWVKNLFVFAPLIFAKHLLYLPDTIKVIFAFIAFSFISSAGYIVNDITDKAKDNKHPSKKNRPVASGKLTVPYAITAAIIIACIGLFIGFYISSSLGMILVTYAFLEIIYSLVLKQIVILDIFGIALGFILRVLSGGVSINVPISHWLLTCTGLLALFLGFAKRRHELIILGDKASEHRSILNEYSPYFLDQMTSVVTSATLIAYIFYAQSSETINKFGTDKLILTTPFVLYGIFRYLYLIHQKKEGGSPTRLLLTDVPLIINIFLWIATAVIIIYL